MTKAPHISEINSENYLCKAYVNINPWEVVHVNERAVTYESEKLL